MTEAQPRGVMTAGSFGTRDADTLARTMKGALLRPSDEGYDKARTIWNAMVDRRPALIARCESAADVKHAVDFARNLGLLLSI